MSFLTTYRTYIAAVVIGAATAAHALGWIDDSTFQAIVGFAGATGMAALRSAITTSATQNAVGNAIIAKEVGVHADTIAAKIASPEVQAAPPPPAA